MLLNRANVVGAPMNENNGFIKRYFDDKRYGFIQSDNGKDFFFHFSSVANDAQPIEGRRVTFVAKETEKGLAAIRVVIDDEQPVRNRAIDNENILECRNIKVYSRETHPAPATVKLSQNFITIEAFTGYLGSRHVIKRRLNNLHSVNVEHGFTGFTSITLFGGGPSVTLERQSIFGNSSFNTLATRLKRFIESRN